jgi:hypothetical protein
MILGVKMHLQAFDCLMLVVVIGKQIKWGILDLILPVHKIVIPTMPGYWFNKFS